MPAFSLPVLQAEPVPHSPCGSDAGEEKDRFAGDERHGDEEEKGGLAGDKKRDQDVDETGSFNETDHLVGTARQIIGEINEPRPSTHSFTEDERDVLMPLASILSGQSEGYVSSLDSTNMTPAARHAKPKRTETFIDFEPEKPDPTIAEDITAQYADMMLSTVQMHYLRPHTVVKGRELYDAFCGRCQGEGELPRKPDTTMPFNENLDWILAIAMIDPQRLPAYRGIGEEEACALYSVCFKPEEWLSGDFTFRAQTLDAEQSVFLQAFRKLPNSGDGRGKSLGEARSGRAYGSDTETPFDTPSHRHPKCFQELLQNVIITKLVLHCGLHVKAVRARDDQHIVLLVTCKPIDLMREADRQGLPTELDILCVDPESLEPCTSTLYPLATWYFQRKPKEVTSDMENKLEELLAKMSSMLLNAPKVVQNRHQQALKYWEACRVKRNRRKAQNQGNLADRRTITQLSNLFSGLSKKSGFNTFSKTSSLERADVERKETLEEHRAFGDYLNLKTAEPLGSPLGPMEQINASMAKNPSANSSAKLRNFYGHLGIMEIPPHDRFEAGMYLGEGGRPWLWRHFGARLQNSDERVAVPFRPHQRINLVRAIVERQLDIEVLRSCGVIATAFPLDTNDKLYKPSDWVVERCNTETRSYYVNLRTGEYSAEKPEEAISASSVESSLRSSWSLPESNLSYAAWFTTFFKSFFRRPPLNTIRDYYGEHIGMYFAVTEHLCAWCTAPACLGVATGIVQLVYSLTDDDNIRSAHRLLSLIYSTAIACWGSAFLESWKRRQAILGALWGQQDASQRKNTMLRPAFRGVLRRNPIDFTNNDEYEVTCFARGRIGSVPRQSLSYLLLTLLSILQLALMGFVLDMVRRWVDQKFMFHERADLVGGLVIGGQMTVMSIVIRVLCRKLNKWENHRTSREYVDSLIIKQSICEFVNQFGFYFYVGFMKGAIQGCFTYDPVTLSRSSTPARAIRDINEVGDAMCVDELSYYVQLMFSVMALMNLTEATGTEWILPYLAKFIRRRGRSSEDASGGEKGEDEALHAPHEGKWDIGKIVQLMLNKEDYGNLDEGGTFDDYLEIVILFGHTTLFSVAFPYAPLIVMILLIVEVRVDGHKLFYTVRRPFPSGGDTIGAWLQVLQFIMWASVITNSVLVVWGLDSFDEKLFGPIAPSTKWLLCMALVIMQVTFKGIIMVGVPDVPESLVTLNAHHSWLTDQLHERDVSIKPNVIGIKDLNTEVHDKVEQRVPSEFGILKREATRALA